MMTATLGAKRLELLRLLVPKANKIGMLVSPNFPDTEAEREDVKAGIEAISESEYPAAIIAINDNEKREVTDALAL